MMLRGDRVALRPIERADLARLWELTEDLEVAVMAELGPVRPTSLAEFEARQLEREREQHRDWVWFAIEADGQVIGACDLHHIHQFTRSCELGIAIGREYWGKGFGQDACRTLVDYAFEHLNMNRVGLYVLADDPRAVGAYQRAGFAEEGRLRQHSWIRGEFHDELVMSVLREDWKPRS
jgi:RimJ/RimL family protein N-acetyltransferase